MMPSIIGNCNRFSLHRVKAELVEVKMENAEILKDWVRVSLTRRKPEPSLLLISRVSFLLSVAISKFHFFYYIFCPENDGVWHFGTSTFVIVPDKLARSLQIAFFWLVNYVFIPIFYIGFILQYSRRYWNIYQIFHIWDGLMLLNWTATRQKHKAGCKKINDTLKVDNLFFRIFLYFYHLFLNFRFAQLTPQIWENYHNIDPFVPIEIILDKKA